MSEYVNNEGILVDTNDRPSNYQDQIKFDLAIDSALVDSLPDNAANNFVIRDILSGWQNQHLMYGGSMDGLPLSTGFSPDDTDVPEDVLQELTNLLYSQNQNQQLINQQLNEEPILIEEETPIINQEVPIKEDNPLLGSITNNSITKQGNDNVPAIDASVETSDDIVQIENKLTEESNPFKIFDDWMESINNQQLQNYLEGFENMDDLPSDIVNLQENLAFTEQGKSPHTNVKPVKYIGNTKNINTGTVSHQIQGASGTIYNGNQAHYKTSDIDWERFGSWDNTATAFITNANNFDHPAYTTNMAGMVMWAPHPEHQDESDDYFTINEDGSYQRNMELDWQFRMYSDDGKSYSVPVDKWGKEDYDTYPIQYLRTYTTHGGDNTMRFLDVSTGTEYYNHYPLGGEKDDAEDFYYGRNEDGNYYQKYGNESGDYEDIINMPGNTFGLVMPTKQSPFGKVVGAVEDAIWLLAGGGAGNMSKAMNYFWKPMAYGNLANSATDLITGFNPLDAGFGYLMGDSEEYQGKVDDKYIAEYSSKIKPTPWVEMVKDDKELNELYTKLYNLTNKYKDTSPEMQEAHNNLLNTLRIPGQESYAGIRRPQISEGVYDWDSRTPGVQTKEFLINELQKQIDKFDLLEEF